MIKTKIQPLANGKYASFAKMNWWSPWKGIASVGMSFNPSYGLCDVGSSSFNTCQQPTAEEAGNLRANFLAQHGIRKIQ